MSKPNVEYSFARHEMDSFLILTLGFGIQFNLWVLKCWIRCYVFLVISVYDLKLRHHCGGFFTRLLFPSALTLNNFRTILWKGGAVAGFEPGIAWSLVNYQTTKLNVQRKYQILFTYGRYENDHCSNNKCFLPRAWHLEHCGHLRYPREYASAAAAAAACNHDKRCLKSRSKFWLLL